MNKQGYYIVGQFDRVFQKRRRSESGADTVSDHVGILIRSESGGTSVVSVKTMNPELYAAYQRDDPIEIMVEVGAYNNYVFFQDLTCRRR